MLYNSGLIYSVVVIWSDFSAKGKELIRVRASAHKNGRLEEKRLTLTEACSLGNIIKNRNSVMCYSNNRFCLCSHLCSSPQLHAAAGWSTPIDKLAVVNNITTATKAWLEWASLGIKSPQSTCILAESVCIGQSKTMSLWAGKSSVH